jgi:hypothetical protein
VFCTISAQTRADCPTACDTCTADEATTEATTEAPLTPVTEAPADDNDGVPATDSPDDNDGDAVTDGPDAVTDAPDNEVQCNAQNWQCHDKKQCVNTAYLCNGKADCADSSDEIGCVVATTDEPATLHPSCNQGGELFVCGNGVCFPRSYQCNAHDDCFDGSDEVGCTTTVVTTTLACAAGQQRCATGGDCVFSEDICDGRVHCIDGSDEVGCTTTVALTTVTATTKTATATTVTATTRTVTTLTTTKTTLTTTKTTATATTVTSTKRACNPNFQWTCGNKDCIRQTLRCDGFADCHDGTDEEECTTTTLLTTVTTKTATTVTTKPALCEANEWQCRSKSCIRDALRCDGHPDCDDFSDELFCTTSTKTKTTKTTTKTTVTTVTTLKDCNVATEFTCGNGECVRSALRCDKVYDCSDYTDEIGCTTTTVMTTTKFMCPLGELRCGNINQCFKKAYLCNKVRDCDDNSDELDCVYTEAPTQAPAGTDAPGDGGGANPTQKPACTQTQFQCTNGDCIRDSLRCDFVIDCADSSDEVLCTTATAAPTAAPTNAPVTFTGAPITDANNNPITDTNGQQLTEVPAPPSPAPTSAPPAPPAPPAPTGAPITDANNNPVTDANSGVQLTEKPATPAATTAPAGPTGAPITDANNNPVTDANSGVQLTEKPATTTRTTRTRTTTTTTTTTTPVVLTLFFRTPPTTTTVAPAAGSGDGGDDLLIDAGYYATDDGDDDAGSSGAGNRTRRELQQSEADAWKQAVRMAVEDSGLASSVFEVSIAEDISYEVTATVTGLLATERDALEALATAGTLTVLVEGESYAAFLFSFYGTTTMPPKEASFGIAAREEKVIRIGVIVGCVVGGFVLGGIMLAGAQCVGRNQEDFDVKGALKGK